jgi:hypothetical protein
MLRFILVLPLLGAAAALASPCEAQEGARLRPGVVSPECGPGASCAKNAKVQVSATGVNEDGQKITIPVMRRGIRSKGLGWSTFRIPHSAKVAVSVYSPPHPLVEYVFHIDADELEKVLELELPAHVQTTSPEIELDVPANIPAGSRDWFVRTLGPKTGHHLSSFIFVDRSPRPFEVPEGDYIFEIDEFVISMCGMGPPRKQSIVPHAAPWSSKNPKPIVLRPQLGSRLELKVNHPTWNKTPEEREESFARKNIGIQSWQNYCGPQDELVAAQLVSVTSGKSYDLKWGWPGLNFAGPWDYFPMGKDVYQIIPVPFGKHKLILKGSGTEELRCAVTMGPDETTKLTLDPIARK